MRFQPLQNGFQRLFSVKKVIEGRLGPNPLEAVRRDIAGPPASLELIYPEHCSHEKKSNGISTLTRTHKKQNPPGLEDFVFR